MKSESCWVGLEGQNFAASILDTQDLSTIRGGSLLMRDLVTSADKRLAQFFPDKVQPATLGGSFGIWHVDAPAKTVQEVLPQLHADLTREDARHLGFGLVAVTDDGPGDGTGFARQRKRIRAALQRARLSENRLPYPDLNSAGQGVCEIDFVRPTSKRARKITGAGEYKSISQAVADRREAGMKGKQKLLREEIAENTLEKAAREALKRDGRPFAMQIASISERFADRPLLKSNLQDKICVIALDGNGFGKIQDAALDASDRIETQKAFDDALASMRRTLVADVFDLVIAEGCEGPPTPEEAEVRKELKDVISPVIRFELLLWGGDEIMFIVPGRVGWRILEQIGHSVARMEFNAADLNLDQAAFDNSKVTFSVGAVFCHHNAPIARVKKLADDLCGHIKGLKRKDNEGRDGKKDTLFMVEVLESFDHVGMDLTNHLVRRTPKWPGDPFSDATKSAVRVLDMKEVKALREVAEALARGEGGALSRGRLRQTAFALHRGVVPGAEFTGHNWADYVRKSASELSGKARRIAEEYFSLPEQGTPAAKEEIRAALGQARLFTLLEEYWDYLTPEKVEEAKA